MSLPTLHMPMRGMNILGKASKPQEEEEMDRVRGALGEHRLESLDMQHVSRLDGRQGWNSPTADVSQQNEEDQGLTFHR